MQLRYLNNRLQYHGPNGWTIVPQAIQIIDCKAIDKECYSIGNNVFIGVGGIFVLNRNVIAKEGYSERLGGVCKKVDIDVRNAIFDLIERGLRHTIIFDKGFAIERRNDQEWLVGFYKTEDDPSFYLIKDAINALKPKDHYPYFEGHFFSPDYNPITGEYGKSSPVPTTSCEDTLKIKRDSKFVEYNIPVTPETKEFQRQLIQEGRAELKISRTYTEEQVRRIFNTGVEAALDPHNTNTCYESVFRETIDKVLDDCLKQEQQLAAQQITDDINPLTKKPYVYTIEIRLNQERTVLNFTTRSRGWILGTKTVRLSMHPTEFLSTFLDWQYVESIRVIIEK